MTNAPIPIKHYLWVFGALLVLTASTVLAAKVDLGLFNTVVAMLIATGKAVLVALFFMHLIHSHHRTVLVALTGLAGLVLLIALSLADELSRGWIPIPSGWQ